MITSQIIQVTFAINVFLIIVGYNWLCFKNWENDMYKNLKMFCVTSICFTFCCFGEGLDPFTNQGNNTQEQINENSQSSYQVNSFSESTSIDKNGHVVYDSTEQASNNGKESEPRKRHFEGNREEFSNFIKDSKRESWKPLKLRRIDVPQKPLSVLDTVAHDDTSRSLEERHNHHNNVIPSRIARKAFKKFMARVAVLIQKKLEELRAEEIKELTADNEVKVTRNSSPEGDNIIISNNEDRLESFDSINEFIQRAFSENGYTLRGKHGNIARRFEKFIRQVQGIAYQTMKEFGIRPSNIERR